MQLCLLTRPVAKLRVGDKEVRGEGGGDRLVGGQHFLHLVDLLFSLDFYRGPFSSICPFAWVTHAYWQLTLEWEGFSSVWH